MGVVFQNGWYRLSVEPSGVVAVADRSGRPIIKGWDHRATYGSHANVVRFLAEQPGQAIVDTPSHFSRGDPIELRVESNRLFSPCIHRAEVESVLGPLVRFQPPVFEAANEFASETASAYIRKLEVEQFLFNVVASVETNADETRIIASGRNRIATVEMELACQRDNPTVEFSIQTKYLVPVEVVSERLSISFAVAATQIVHRNCKLSVAAQSNGHWLDRQGVVMGQGTQCATTYHNPDIGALWLAPDGRGLDIILDDWRQHRFRRHVLSSDSYYEERHATRIRPGDQRQHRFRLHLGFEPPFVPRLMPHPQGAVATHIVTEHADDTTLETQRAANFGSDRIAHAEGAIGGFVKHGIPVTKSIFYVNPNDVPCLGQKKEPQFSLKEKPEHLDFLERLVSQGHEICLHTAQPDNHDREAVAEALAFVTQRFGSEAWIDHAPTFVRPSLSADGGNSSSPSYSRDLLEDAGIRFIWHVGCEDRGCLPGGPGLDLLWSSGGDHLPMPLWWRAQDTGDLVSWPAQHLNYDLWMSLHTDESLAELVASWGVHIAHAYPSRICAENKMIMRGEDGRWTIEPEFDKTLARIAALSAEGDLNLSTVSAFFSRCLAIELVDVSFRPNGETVLLNNGHETIQDLTVAVRAPSISVLGAKHEFRRVGEDVLAWFDLRPQDPVKITRYKALS